MKQHTLLSLLLALILLLTAIPAMGEGEESGAAVPLPSALLTGELSDAYIDEDGALVISYASADEADLDYYLTLCTLLNIYKLPLADSDLLGYSLLSPEAGYIGTAYYLPEEESVVILSEGISSIVTDESISLLLGLFETEIQLPSNAAGNVAPQFYAVANREPVGQNMVSGSLFEGQMCWTEYYDEISTETLNNYAIYMLLFGYDAQITGYQPPSEEKSEIYRIQFSNGDAEIVIDYNVSLAFTTVSYEPGVSYYLLDGAAMNEAFGY